MWNKLVDWHRGWEDEQLRILDHPELATTLPPGYRRYFGCKLAEMSFIERQQLRDFSLKYRGWRLYAAIARMLLLFAVAGLAADLVFPKIGVFKMLVVTNSLGIAGMIVFTAVWFNYRKMAGKTRRMALNIMAYGIVAGLASIWMSAIHKGSSLQETLAAQGPAIMASVIGVTILFALPVALVGLLRNQQYHILTARLELDAERERAARELSESHLRLLRAQIEPHFLFNTLGAVQQLADKGAPLAAELTANLIAFLRASLAEMRSERVTLRADFNLIEAYLQVMKARMGERLHYRLNLPDGLANINVPGMMLLTLVENAIKHGIEPSLRGGAIGVTAERQGDMIRIRVQDSGVGMSAAPGAGDGIENVRTRLLLSYAGAASLAIHGADGGGVIADILLPAGAAEKEQ